MIPTHRQPEQQHAKRLGGDHLGAEDRLLERLGGEAQALRDRVEQDRAEDHAGHVAHAAEHHHRDDDDRLHQDEALGGDETLEGGEHRARNAAERSPIANASSFTLRVLMPIALAAVSSSRIATPGTADARVLQPDRHDDHAHRQHQEQVVVELHRLELEAADLERPGEVHAGRSAPGRCG